MAFTHIDEGGNAIMVDVSQKDVTHRTATARGVISMRPDCLAMVQEGRAKKGDVLAVAQVAGIMAAKQTAALIPLCHVLALDNASVAFTLHPERSEIEAVCTVRCTGRTGVEMEALTGVSVALLTVYDMCKAVDRAMCIREIHLLEKQGGKSGHFIYGQGACGHEGSVGTEH